MCVYVCVCVWGEGVGLSPLYDLVLTSVHDDRKNHSLNYMDLCLGPFSDQVVCSFTVEFWTFFTYSENKSFI